MGAPRSASGSGGIEDSYSGVTHVSELTPKSGAGVAIRLFLSTEHYL